MKRKLFPNSDYLKKLAALSTLRNEFLQWKQEMESLEDPSLEKCIDLIKKHKLTFPRFVVPNIDFSLKVFRVRTIVADSIEDICDPKTFSYPPVACCNDFQRASVPGHPVFYAAADAKTAMEEVKINGGPIKPGDKIFLSQWRIKKGAKYSLNYLTRPEIVGEEHGYKDLTQKLYSEMDRIFSQEEVFFGKRQRLLFDLTSSLFFSDSYIASGMIGYETLYQTEEVNGIKIVGISYPSCANNFRGVNFAFHPDFVNECMELESVRLVTFKEFNDEGAQTTGNYNGNLLSGRINWTCFTVYLMMNEVTSKLYLSEDCEQEDVYGADLQFRDGTVIALQEYTKQQLAKIDLSNMEVSPENEHYYIGQKAMQYTLKLSFEPEIGALKIGERLIPIVEMHITVPIQPKVENVTPSRVLSKLK